MNPDPNASSPSNEEITRSVLEEQARANLTTAKVTLRSGILVSLSAAAIVGLAEGNWKVVPWVLAILFVTAVRLFQIEVFERNDTVRRDPAMTLRRSWQSSVVQGVLWGILPFLVMPGPPEGELAFLAFIFAGTTAGSVIQSRAFAMASIAFITPSLAGLVVWCFWIGTYGSLILAANVLLLIVLMAQNLRAAERNFVATHRLRFEATALAVSLDAARAREAAARERLAVIAATDALTGLNNRAAFNAGLADACSRAEAGGRRFALFLIDIDNFKSINDTLGHTAGDAVLVELARTLAETLGGRERVARLGGDEFAVVIEDDPDDDAIEAIAQAVLAALAAPLRIGGRLTVVGGSIGAAVFPGDATSAVDLLACADIALYAAKDDGRRRFKRFDGRLRKLVDDRRRIELDLAEAIATGSIEVHYQPQVAIPGGRTIGLEALIRWHHPTMGWVPPPDVVQAAASAFLSDRLTAHVVENCCRMIRMMDEAGFDPIPIGVNLSPRDFRLYSPADLISRICARHGVPVHRLEVEITEEAILETSAGDAELERLAGLGIGIAVDDFGAGHSSLAHLATLRAGRIKIDRRFVQKLELQGRDRAVVEAILGIGRVLDVRVLAEGVETAAQAKTLAALGCQEAQGYLFGRPAPAGATIGWITARNTHEGGEEHGEKGVFPPNFVL